MSRIQKEIGWLTEALIIVSVFVVLVPVMFLEEIIKKHLEVALVVVWLWMLATVWMGWKVWHI